MEKLDHNVTELNSWHDVDWKATTSNVRSLRERIFVASKENDLKRVSRLQKLMLRSRSNWLISIRRVTQHNKGRWTPGVDKEVYTTPEERLGLFHWLETIRINDWNPPPVRRVYIAKDKGKKRALGIPTVKDRIIQAIVKNALEPFWEARFEPTSHGFRPGRSAHDALQDIHNGTRHRWWILDADIKGAFDHIKHAKLMEIIGNFPARRLIERWLKAGVMEGQDFSPNIDGTPQGGLISPLLANIALHGMEKALGYKWITKTVTRTLAGTQAVQVDLESSPQKRGYTTVKLVRYADDFVVLGKTREEVQKAQTKLETFLAERGLEMSPEKTRITHLDEGFDFLGFHIRRVPSTRSAKGYQIVTWPSTKSVNSYKAKLKKALRDGRHWQLDDLIIRIGSLNRGWANYFRVSAASDAFSKLDHYTWQRFWSFLCRRHPKLGRKKIRERFYTTHRQNRWILRDPETGVTLPVMARVPIERHRKVAHFCSPDDPERRGYWEVRRKKSLELSPRKRKLWVKQNGLCAHCQGELDTGEELQAHHTRGRDDDDIRHQVLLHEMCHQQITQLARVA